VPVADPPASVAEATESQPGARLALSAALASEPSHAYLFTGPRGTGKRGAARAFAAELLARDAPDPDEARRRAMLDPSPHPDLVWVTPPGTQHLVEEIRDRVIRSAAYRPFEGERRAFVIEAAEAMRDESQNALLKTLEEPPGFVHVLLLSSEPAALLETVVSRCQPVRFAALSPEAVERLLAADPGGPGAELEAAARLSGGDLDRARLLVSDPGRELRARAERCARAARAGRLGDAPWRDLLEAAEASGEEAATAASARVAGRAEAAGEGAQARRLRREGNELARRAGRRRRTEALDLSLALCGSWFRDLGAVAEGAPELAMNTDRVETLGPDAEGVDPPAARHAVDLVLDTRRRLRVNVSEELALEALFYRLEALFT
jgi:DNA polymerase III subunit delta'